MFAVLLHQSYYSSLWNRSFKKACETLEDAIHFVEDSLSVYKEQERRSWPDWDMVEIVDLSTFKVAKRGNILESYSSNLIWDEDDDSDDEW